MSENLDMEHFADPSEPGAKGHQAWLREQEEAGWDLLVARHADGEQCEQATTTRDCPRNHEYTRVVHPTPTLNDQLAEEATRVELGALRTIAARGTKHDPDL